MLSLLLRVAREEEGATALEYGLLTVLVALVMAGGAVVLGEGMNTLFGNTGTEVEATQPASIPTPSPDF